MAGDIYIYWDIDWSKWFNKWTCLHIYVLNKWWTLEIYIYTETNRNENKHSIESTMTASTTLSNYQKQRHIGTQIWYNKQRLVKNSENNPLVTIIENHHCWPCIVAWVNIWYICNENSERVERASISRRLWYGWQSVDKMYIASAYLASSHSQQAKHSSGASMKPALLKLLFQAHLASEDPTAARHGTDLTHLTAGALQNSEKRCHRQSHTAPGVHQIGSDFCTSAAWDLSHGDFKLQKSWPCHVWPRAAKSQTKLQKRKVRKALYPKHLPTKSAMMSENPDRLSVFYNVGSPFFDH